MPIIEIFVWTQRPLFMELERENLHGFGTGKTDAADQTTDGPTAQTLSQLWLDGQTTAVSPARPYSPGLGKSVTVLAKNSQCAPALHLQVELNQT